jgi:hypothetical protein
MMPLAEHIHFLALPVFLPAGIIFSDNTPKGFGPTQAWTRILNIKAAEKLGPSARFGMRNQLHIDYFTRMLAKIAHAYATAELGVNGFKPLTTDYIRGKSTDGPHFIGGDLSGSIWDGRAWHMCQWYRRRSVSGRKLFVVDVQLFAPLNAPVYHVVVGEALPA